MRVVHITNAGGFGRVQAGGAERGVAELSSILAERFGWDELVIAPHEYFPQWEFSPLVRKVPLDLSAFGLVRALNPRGPLQKALRELAPDVVVTHLLRGTLAGLPAAKTATRAGCVSILHNSLHDYAGRTGQPLRRRINELGFRAVGGLLADAHVAISDANRDDLIRYDHIKPERVHRIYNWVSSDFAADVRAEDSERLRAELGVASAALLIGFFGRLEKQKQPEFLIRQLPSLDGAVLMIGGEGTLRPQCERLCQALGVASRIRFLGFRTDVAQLMAAADVVAVPSEFEGFGRVAVEALAVGTPVVGADVPGLGEVLRRAPKGTTEAIRTNDVAAWRAAIHRLAADGVARRAEMAQYVRDTFSLEAAATAYDQLFRAVAAKNARR